MNDDRDRLSQTVPEHPSGFAAGQVPITSLPHLAESKRKRAADGRQSGGEYRFLYWE